jgi:energy-coupling factor transporter ATP-binding protein EcfA2
MKPAATATRCVQMMRTTTLIVLLPGIAALAAGCNAGSREAGELRVACEAGNAQACTEFAERLLAGAHVLRDDARAAALLNDTCEAGAPAACARLGTLYEAGRGVDGDTARATELYDHACGRGAMEGCVRLGMLYDGGHGLPRDPAAAAALYERACRNGEARGCARAGLLYRAGDGVTQNDVRAASYFEQACDGGIAAGCTELGRLYAAGDGVGRDIARAFALFDGACAEDDALISADSLTKRYRDVVALDDVSFTISDGITGILGENGAGKSTAIRVFLGLIRPTSGTATVLVRGRVGECGRARAAGLHAGARLPAEPHERGRVPDAHGRGERTAAIGGAYAGSRHAAAHRPVRGAYRAMGGYSTGMKQRVKLAQALVHDPAVVFLDEPTAGLDPAGREEMLHLVRQDAPRVRHQRAVLVAPHVRRRAQLRPHARAAGWAAGGVGSGRAVHQETETVFIEVDTNRDRLVAALERRGVVFPRWRRAD